MVEKYAVVQSGGKQYRVQEGQKLKLETIDGEIGSKVSIDSVLVVGNGEQIVLGSPTVDQAKVEVEILAHGRHDKVNIIKFKRRKHHLKRAGHRQNFTQVKVLSISN